jgi:phosphoglycolate phosphatase-like HAD superfamily hydrolase
MWTILFDIDGTLIRCGGAGMSAMGQTVAELFGLREIPEIPLHGRTDRGIVGDLFERLQIDLDGDYSGFYEIYFQRLKTVLKTSNGEVLPGVFELLTKLNEMPTVALGILTGNASEAAAIKLEHFQLSEYFLFGGYGDDHHDRNDVAAQAVTAASKSLGSRFDPSKVWVIGDTSNDIRCARSIGAKVFAVTTGGESLEQLSESNPDFLKDDLNDVNEWLSNLH